MCDLLGLAVIPTHLPERCRVNEIDVPVYEFSKISFGSLANIAAEKFFVFHVGLTLILPPNVKSHKASRRAADCQRLKINPFPNSRQPAAGVDQFASSLPSFSLGSE